MKEAVVTSKGRTTIPIFLRKKYGIIQGSRLEVEDTGDGILMKKLPSVLDMIGSGSDHATVEEVKRMLDLMRRGSDEKYLATRGSK
jgi:AbrB family looped-hinge helix DNA binding protein